MDQIKTGGFIAAKRKEKGLTQRELADRLGISDKTVSKWECGKGMPELSLMQPLCRELGFSVNELLSGETLDDDYREKAEQNLLQLIDERKQAPARWKTAAVLAGCFAAAAGLWFLLLVNSNIYSPTGGGLWPTPLTLRYLAGGFLLIYAAMTAAGLAALYRKYLLMMAVISVSALVCLCLSLFYEMGQLALAAAAGLVLCLGISVWLLLRQRAAGRRAQGK